METAPPLRILIVEDDLVDRKMLRRLLAQSALGAGEVQQADCLAQALELLHAHSFDVILLDLGLPDSQGMDSVVRVQTQTPQTPIIVLSGLDDANVATQAVQIGAQDYLIKGQVDASLLMRAIRYALERKKAERQLLVKDRAVNSATNGIAFIDLDGRITFANASCLKMWGFQEEAEVLQKPFLSFLHAEQEGWAAYQSTLTVGAWSGELAARKKDDSEFVVQVSTSVVKDKQGQPICLMAFLTDVTESRRVREILDRKQRNLEAIFDAAPLGMLLVNQQLRVARANDSIRQMSGKGYPAMLDHDPCQALGCLRTAPDETCGTTDGHERQCSCGDCRLRETIQTALASDLPVRGVEVRPPLNTDGDQAQRWLSVSVEPVHIDGATHVLVVLNDITDRKRAEEELKETMEMKSQFISTVSHELRTPMTSMKEAVIIVLDEIAGRINQDQKHFLEIAKRNIDRLARLIDDVLDFQKLNAGKMKFNLQAHPIAALVEEAYATMQPQAAKSQVDLALDLQTDLPAVVCDGDRIMQVLTNLLSNALKFTPAGGRVLLSVHRRDDQLIIRVRDTGYGIPKEDLPKLFSQFFRVQRPGKEIKGTGLGLAIVSKIVTGHGGRIEVESELNEGTTFAVFLPLPAPHPASRLDQPAPCLESPRPEG